MCRRSVMAGHAVVRSLGLGVIKACRPERGRVVTGFADRGRIKMAGRLACGSRRTRVARHAIGSQVGVIRLCVCDPRRGGVAGIAVGTVQCGVIGRARHGIAHPGIVAIAAWLTGNAAMVHVDGEEGRRRVTGAAIVRSRRCRMRGRCVLPAQCALNRSIMAREAGRCGHRCIQMTECGRCPCGIVVTLRAVRR